MKCDKHTMLLYAVTDRAWTGRETLRQQVEDALKGGVTCVQLREKELNDAAFLQEAMELSSLCRSYGVPFIINDNVEIAIKCHADGIHVGQEDMAAADVRAMSADQLNDELAKLKKEQFNLRFQKATGQLEKSSRILEVRRDIARVKTIARQKAAEAKA